MELVRTVKKILAIETRLVQEASSGSAANGQEDVKPNSTTEKVAKINKELENLYTMTQDAEADLRKLQSKQEYFVINYQESVKIQSSLQQIQQMPASDPTRTQLEQQLVKKKNEVDQLLQQEAHKLLQQRTALGIGLKILNGKSLLYFPAILAFKMKLRNKYLSSAAKKLS